MKYCSSCKAGEVKELADYLVQGKIQGDYKMMPYKAYICEDHYQMLLDDGAELRIIERVK